MKIGHIASILLALAILAAACSSDTVPSASTQPEQSQDSSPAETPTTGGDESPPAENADDPEPTAAPPQSDPTQVPEPAPTATPVPVPTVTPVPTPDATPTLFDSGDGWVFTEGDLARLMAFIEDIHELEFRAPVDVVVLEDIGLERAARFEAFSEEAWFLLSAFGITDPEENRQSVNQVRRDRIRGVCCNFQPNTSVAV